MKLVLITVVLLLLNTVYCRPSTDDDYDPEFGEDDKDMQNDNYDDYSDGGDDEDSGVDIPEPQIITKSNEFIARENETVYLPCEVSNAKRLVTLWKKNDKVIFQDNVKFEDFGDNYERLPNRTLVIKQVTANEAGEYTCSIPLTQDNEMSVSHHVTVQTAPSIISLEAANNKTMYEAGETLELTCKAAGYPQPTIKWSLKGQRLQAQGESITIDNIGHHNAGSYQCLADNNIGQPAHKSIRINVVHKPLIKIEKLTVNAAENYDSELICIVHAIPEATVNWMKDGANIEPDERITARREGHSYILQIRKTQIADLGEYTCSAVNKVGKNEKNISLTATPGPAQFLKGYEDHDMKSPVLSWTIESNSPITEHILQYRRVGDAKWNILKPEVTNPEGNIYTIKATISDLNEGQYEAKVRSCNTYGWSQWSEHKIFNGVLAPRTLKHHLHPSTTYDVNHTGPETKSLENEIPKENIREGAITGSKGTVFQPISLLCVLLALLANRH